MTNAAIAAALQFAGVTAPAQIELVQTRVLTCKGTTDTPAGGCGVGCSDVNDGYHAWNTLGDLVCVSGANNPQDIEEVQTIVLTQGSRTDSYNY